MGYFSEFIPYTMLAMVLVGLYFLLEEELSMPWMRRTWWAVCVLLLMFVGWQAGTSHMWADFGNGYFYGGRKILRDIESLYGENACGGYVNFPLFAYLFVPFGLIEKAEAGRLFFIINLVSLLPLAYWLVKFGGLTGWKRWTILVLLACSGPLDYSLWLGNSSNLVLLFMILALWYLKGSKEFGSGVLLAMNGMIKIPLILPCGYFLIRKQWKVVAGGVFAAGLAVGLSLILIPHSINIEWLNNCILSFSGRPVAAFNNQSVSGVLARQLIPDSQVDHWLPLDPPAGFRTVTMAASLLLYAPAALVLITRWRSARTVYEQTLEFFILLTCSLLTSPISWTHYYLFLLAPLVFYLDERNFLLRARGLNLLLLIGSLLVSLPINLTNWLYESSGMRDVLSIHFWGALMVYLFLIFLWMRHRVGIAQD